MKDTSPFTITVPLVKPKYRKAAHGIYIYQNGKLYFKSGKNIVYIREHFSCTGATPEKLIENTVRYDNENSSSALESEDSLCYNDGVNDVL